jgi:hypothetical protein
MTTEKQPQGEGNYAAARDYDEKAAAHARDASRVEAAAQAASDALDSAEARELAAAERAGKARARR